MPAHKFYRHNLPKQLHRGDKVALVAPASGQKEGEEKLVQQALILLQNWGLEVVVQPIFDRHSRYLASDDKKRAENLIEALTHPEVRAIFVTRGGYGCARLLPFLGGIAIPSWRFLVGFSDITSLHLHFAQTPNILNLHAPNLATGQVLGGDTPSLTNLEVLESSLFAGELPIFTLKKLNQGGQSLPADKDNVLSCLKTGGCLSLLVTSLGTADEINTANKVLMIEEVGECPYKIDRMLTHLRNAGKFDKVIAVIFGEMLNCNSLNIDILDCLSDYFAMADFTVYTCSDFGHGEINLPWFYGEIK